MGSTTEKIRTRKDSGTSRSFVSRKESRGLFFQPKLTVGPADDVYEQEADAVADKIMRMPEGEEVQPKISPVDLQRKCSECEKEDENIQRKENSTGNKPSEAPSIVSDALNSGGRPLDKETKSFMEDRFGYDFSHVKIHADTVAAKSAKSINALAYTSGSSIVFNEGQYSPGTEKGKKLLAHELTHVVQQGGELKRKRIQRQVEDEVEEEVESDPADSGPEAMQQKQGGCAAESTRSYLLANQVDFEITVPRGCRATLTFTALWVSAGESAECCTGADTYRVTRNGTARNLPAGPNICEGEHRPRVGTISTGSGRQRFRISVDRSGCDGIKLELGIRIRIR